MICDWDNNKDICTSVLDYAIASFQSNFSCNVPALGYFLLACWFAVCDNRIFFRWTKCWISSHKIVHKPFEANLVETFICPKMVIIFVVIEVGVDKLYSLHIYEISAIAVISHRRIHSISWEKTNSNKSRWLTMDQTSQRNNGTLRVNHSRPTSNIWFQIISIIYRMSVAIFRVGITLTSLIIRELE